MTRISVFGDKARAGLQRGVNIIAGAVKATLGPRGMNVVYSYHYGNPITTKDGVTVARQVESKDELEQMGILMIREVAQKTADNSGDGTTTASVLAQSIYNEGLKYLGTGVSSVLIKRSIDKAVNEVIDFILKQNKEIIDEKEAKQIAMISSNNDSIIGDSVFYALDTVGKNGVVTLEDNPGSEEIIVELVEGMQLNEGMLSPFFMTDPERLICEYPNTDFPVEPKILLVDGDLSDIQPLKALIEDCIMAHKKPLVIIAHNISGPALQALALSKAQKGIPVLGCKAPQFGEYRENMLEDIAIFTGSVIMGGKLGIRAMDIKYDMLGSCNRIVSDRFKTTITNGFGDKEKINGRINLLTEQIQNSVSDYDKEKLQERLAKLTTGVAVIKVGGNSETEQKERKMRVEDSLLATQAAMEEGIVPGGGIIYLRASNYLKEPEGTTEERIGYSIIKRALRSPILQIASNSGIVGEEVIANILISDNYNYGYDFLNNKYGNMFEMGIVDPTKVVKNALINAASVAGTMLTTEVCVYQDLGDIEPSMTPRPKGEG